MASVDEIRKRLKSQQPQEDDRNLLEKANDAARNPLKAAFYVAATPAAVIKSALNEGAFSTGSDRDLMNSKSFLEQLGGTVQGTFNKEVRDRSVLDNVSEYRKRAGGKGLEWYDNVESRKGRLGKGVLNFVVDIAADPTSYLGVGFVDDGAKAGVLGAQKATKSATGRDVFEAIMAANQESDKAAELAAIARNNGIGAAREAVKTGEFKGLKIPAHLTGQAAVTVSIPFKGRRVLFASDHVDDVFSGISTLKTGKNYLLTKSDSMIDDGITKGFQWDRAITAMLGGVPEGGVGRKIGLGQRGPLLDQAAMRTLKAAHQGDEQAGRFMREMYHLQVGKGLVRVKAQEARGSFMGSILKPILDKAEKETGQRGRAALDMAGLGITDDNLKAADEAINTISSVFHDFVSQGKMSNRSIHRQTADPTAVGEYFWEQTGRRLTPIEELTWKTYDSAYRRTTHGMNADPKYDVGHILFSSPEESRTATALAQETIADVTRQLKRELTQHADLYRETQGFERVMVNGVESVVGDPSLAKRAKHWARGDAPSILGAYGAAFDSVAKYSATRQHILDNSALDAAIRANPSHSTSMVGKTQEQGRRMVQARLKLQEAGAQMREMTDVLESTFKTGQLAASPEWDIIRDHVIRGVDGLELSNMTEWTVKQVRDALPDAVNEADAAFVMSQLRKDQLKTRNFLSSMRTEQVAEAVKARAKVGPGKVAGAEAAKHKARMELQKLEDEFLSSMEKLYGKEKGDVSSLIHPKGRLSSAHDRKMIEEMRKAGEATIPLWDQMLGALSEEEYITAFKALADLEFRKLADGRYIDRKVFDEIASLHFAANTGTIRQFFGNFKQIAHLQRMQLLLSPAFSIRNQLGGVWNNHYIGVSLSDYRAAAREFVTPTEGADRVLMGLRERLPEFSQDYIRRSKLSQAIEGGQRGLLDTQSLTPGRFESALHRTSEVFEDFNPVKRVLSGQSTGSEVKAWRNKIAGTDTISVEALNRGAAYLKLVRKDGMHPNEAWAKVNQLHFDYSDLSALDITIKNVIPFWTFTSRNLPLQMEMLARGQGIARQFEMERQRTVNSDDSTPPFMSDKVASFGGGLLMNTASIVPVTDAATFGNPFTELGSGVSPVANVGIKLSRGQDDFGRPYGVAQALADMFPVYGTTDAIAVKGNLPGGRSDKNRLPYWENLGSEFFGLGLRDFGG